MFQNVTVRSAIVNPDTHMLVAYVFMLACHSHTLQKWQRYSQV